MYERNNNTADGPGVHMFSVVSSGPYRSTEIPRGGQGGAREEGGGLPGSESKGPSWGHAGRRLVRSLARARPAAQGACARRDAGSSWRLADRHSPRSSWEAREEERYAKKRARYKD